MPIYEQELKPDTLPRVKIQQTFVIKTEIKYLGSRNNPIRVKLETTNSV